MDGVAVLISACLEFYVLTAGLRVDEARAAVEQSGPSGRRAWLARMRLRERVKQLEERRGDVARLRG